MSMFTACTRLKFGMKRKQKRYEEQNLQLMCSPVGRFKTVVEEGSSNVQLYQISTQQSHKLYFKERDLKRRSQVTAIPCDMVPSSGIRKSLQYHLDEQNKTNLDHVDEADDVGVIDLPQDENLRHETILQLLTKPSHGDLLDCNHGSIYKMPPFPHHRKRTRPDLSSHRVIPDYPPAHPRRQLSHPSSAEQIYGDPKIE